MGSPAGAESADILPAGHHEAVCCATVPLTTAPPGTFGDAGLLSPSPELPVVENLPSGLVHHGISVCGLDADGWLAASASFEIEQPGVPAEFVVQAKVPLVDDAAFTTDLLVLIDGRDAAQATLGTGRFTFRTPVPPGPARRRVELRFSAVQRLLPPDIRWASAYVQRIGFDLLPAAQLAAAPDPVNVSVAPADTSASATPPALAPLYPADALPPDGQSVTPPSTPEPEPAPRAGPLPDPEPAPVIAAPAAEAAPAVADRTLDPPVPRDAPVSTPATAPAAGRPVATVPTLPPPPARIFAGEIVFGPEAPPIGAELRELWRYRHLFRALVWRNVRIEFDATRLGSLWAIARPVLFAVVFGFFRNLSGANTYVEIPYIPYLFSGLLLWTYFTDVATNTASAIRSDLALLTKVYYPRLLTPLVPAVSNLLTLVIGMVVLAGMMVWLGLRPGWMLVLLPVVVLPCIILALGIGLLVSSLSVENRDWERVLAYSLTIGLWLSPVIYSPDMIPQGARALYHLNPMAGPLLAFRAVLFDGVPFPLWEWAYGALASCVTLLLGLRVFRRTEVRLVDRL